MWIVRFLTGPLAGQTIPLHKNSVILGRAPSCDLKIPSSSVSKEHVQLEILDDRVLITDMNSRNGTFLNGVQVRSSKARSGDRLALHDVILELQQVPDQWAHQFQQGSHGSPGYSSPYAIHGNVAYHSRPHHESDHSPPSPEPGPQKRDIAEQLPALIERLQEYFEQVAMPGIYRVAQFFEFKWLLVGFMTIFVFAVTSLSVIPLMRILKTSVEQESQHHALTIATNLAQSNRAALSQGMDTAVSVETAAARPGVKKALIISNMDGNVIAPASQAGSVPDLPYIHEARKRKNESVTQLDSDTVVAMHPIEFFNPESGSQAITAWAVVFYDMGSLEESGSQILSLFVTTLCIALAVGFLLFYLLYRIIEHPIRLLNEQLDVALREGHDTLSVPYQFPALQTLASNVSSALNRALSGGGGAASHVPEHDRKGEIKNLVELMGFAAAGIHAHDLSLAAANQSFEQRTGMSADQMMSMGVDGINDQALKLSIKDLIARVDSNPNELAANELEFSGSKFQVVAVGIFGNSKLAYYLVVLLPLSEAG